MSVIKNALLPLALLNRRYMRNKYYNCNQNILNFEITSKTSFLGACPSLIFWGKLPFQRFLIF
jgi:hypothetical protein